ncbi:Uncharacterized conserved protein [Plasmopara halstedii]|uniref:Uncharacterized conserved protein n=1 Tax=Plasmopara halstedii TaxID=4781 RepID=A0A0P1AJK1_PLAHL|nr:Uncharacterized conserved protein [Plasmopara halstedii]CEG41393.1 Uncharacterized conserved protein [Plasmopara halstedii]|eukprot:XP_024577762.1 Uncharacterized conserved protein [Plasmopara halstedii]
MTEARIPPAVYTKTDWKIINGLPTDFAVSIFADRVFIAVTQLGTFGTLLEAYQKDTISGKLQSDIHVRLGRRDDPLLLVYARQLLEHFGVPVGLPVLVAIGLKDRSSQTFEVVMKCVKELFSQARNAQAKQ